MLKILAALRTVPNVRSLALLKPVEASHGAGGNAPLRLYDAVLRQLPALYPQLDALAVDTDDHALGFLRGLRRLRRLHFSGRARATPMEALAVLGQLHCLEELEVTATTAASAEGDAGARGAPQPCLTREVLRGLGGGGGGRLRALAVREGRADGGTERGRAGARVAPGFVDAATMRAVGAAFRVRRVDVVCSGGVLPADALDALPASVEELSLEGVGMRGLGVLARKKREGLLGRLRKVAISGAPGTISEVC